MRFSLRISLLSIACCVALSAHAQAATRHVDIPAGSLAAALDALARQSDTQMIYRPDQLKGLKTSGVRGELSTEGAVDRLLRGSGFVARRDASGAWLIARQDPAVAPPAPAPAPRPQPASAPPAPVTEIESIQVTGSRIPRAQFEGPAPITVMTSEDIRANGFVSVPDVLRAMTQNGGETQSQQSASGADFSPGAQQVDLRGLGPNHTLVLVNGRRIADFPMPFKGRSNFADISNIPLGMIDRIEILTGSASAIYGSDAISGVVNFILKKKADGTTIDYRYGDTSRGGGESHKLSLSSGFSSGDFDAVFGLELLDQKPLWAYDRKLQDSTQDAPTATARSARRTFLRTAWDPDDGDNEYYVDPGQATCDALSYLNGGSTYRADRPRWGRYDPATDDYPPGYFCGSDAAIGYGTMLSRRKGANAYGSMHYRLGDSLEWFADVQLGHHEIALFRDVEQWSYQAPDGNEAGYFYNQATSQVEYWQRQFTPEEMGGLHRGMIETTQKTFAFTTGLTGSFGQDWDFEAAFSHSQYKSVISWPQTVAAKANALMLGPQLGIDEDSGLPIFNADPARLYTPLTRAEYDAITSRSVYHPRSRTDTLSFSLTNTSLFDLPGGPAGFAAIAEVGNQAYDLNPDPLATQYHYYSWKDSDGHGSRNRWALGGELRLPVLERLNLSLATRYDRYRFAGTGIGKQTFSAGIEWRPLDTLLLRGSYGTAFRAPDLHYVFAGIGNDETSGVDYYRCRTEEPDEPIGDCSYSEEGLVRTREGNRRLEPETSKSWTAGFVWSPTENFDLSVDYYSIDMDDQVQDMRVDAILQDEANCRLGRKADGTAVDIGSPTCVDALARVTRLPNGNLYGIYVNPINVANERTSGIDASLHYRLPTAIGDFRLSASYTRVRRHLFQQFAGDVTDDEFAINSGYDIPRTKVGASLSWQKDAWTATLRGDRLGRLPTSDSYDGVYDPEDANGVGPWIGATYRYNASLQYRIGERMRIGLTVDNLFDKMPPKDPTYTAYPYYDISWFDAVGRSYYLNFTYKFGGGPLD